MSFVELREASPTSPIWHVEVRPSAGQPDPRARQVETEASELGLGDRLQVTSTRGFLVQGSIEGERLADTAVRVLADPVVEQLAVHRVPAETPTTHNKSTDDESLRIHVLPKPGVTDSVADNARRVLRQHGLDVDHLRTIRSYTIQGSDPEHRATLIRRVLANAAIEQSMEGDLVLDHLVRPAVNQFELIHVPLRDLDDQGLEQVSRDGQLALDLDEMRVIQAHFRAQNRDPTDCELETIAQTWSEHCSHKTFRGRVAFEDGTRYENLLKETIFAATHQLAERLDWLVSVFSDNAGIIRFDESWDVCFKVETHNRPSAIDPYGGANTGIGGVIRDPLGTGLGAKPIANTDVFCVADPQTDTEHLPTGVLHPRRILRGVVAGVRDYGNRMGIPTVNGALVVEPRYLANPLVFCGTVGILPRGMDRKAARPGDRIVVVGGRTGRDGIHGATFSSVGLHEQSEILSGGAVQIGNAIVEKMMLDVILQARDAGLIRAITDCGAGGFSSAIGEMGADLGVEVDLERAPLKYDGLTYTEVWISESQERMILAVDPNDIDALIRLCEAEGVEAADLGEFVDSGRLTLRHHGRVVCDLEMEFLHEGRPAVVRTARVAPAPEVAPQVTPGEDLTDDLVRLLSCLDIASKEWIVRQYDHEVQAGTVLKPMVGVRSDGPGDASVIRPVADSPRGLALACGINPRYGDLDTYAMAECVIDEAIRNCVAVGADPGRIALLDNFCWGNCQRPETLGDLVRAAEGCRDAALAFEAPFISGKDSLNNEFRAGDRSQAIPHTLLVSALGQVPDVRRCVSMDLKNVGNQIYLIGETDEHLGGSHWLVIYDQHGAGRVPRVAIPRALACYRVLHEAIQRGLIRSAHDLSEGGLAVSLAEMAIAGDLGLSIDVTELVDGLQVGSIDPVAVSLFSESPSRLVLEVAPEYIEKVERLFMGLPLRRLGEVIGERRLSVCSHGRTRLDAEIETLRKAWQEPLNW